MQYLTNNDRFLTTYDGCDFNVRNSK